MDDRQSFSDSFVDTLSEVLQLPLYLFTLVAEGLTAGLARLWLSTKVWLILGLVVHPPFSPEFVGWICLLGPLVWSASSFWYPGKGRLWQERVGAHHLSQGEAKKVEQAFDSLGRELAGRLKRLSVYVIDTEDRFAFVRGDALVISRGLIESEYLTAVLAHELGHASTTDGRLMQALDRLALWGDPLVRARDEDTLREHGTMAALFVGGLRWLLRVAGGTLTLRGMSPLWARYWRRRERAADEYAVALGQGPVLAQYLKNWKQPQEQPNPRLLFNLHEYERVACRRDVLEAEPTHT